MMVRRDPESTRRELLDAAFEEMYAHGFQATGVDQILARTGVTKGALYHHFKNKHDLGYAVFDEVIRPRMLGVWLKDLDATTDPVTVLKERMYAAIEEAPPEFMQCGCPLNNLTQEMSQVDPGFGGRIEALLVDWREAVSGALQRGIEAGTVRSDIDADGTAAFLIAGWEGMAGMAKGTSDERILMRMGRVMERFLDDLRPAPVEAGVGR